MEFITQQENQNIHCNIVCPAIVQKNENFLYSWVNDSCVIQNKYLCHDGGHNI